MNLATPNQESVTDPFAVNLDAFAVLLDEQPPDAGTSALTLNAVGPVAIAQRRNQAPTDELYHEGIVRRVAPAKGSISYKWE